MPAAPARLFGGSEQLLASQNLFAKALWTIQRPNCFNGGALVWRERICLRHMGTGCFLTVVRQDPSSGRTPCGSREELVFVIDLPALPMAPVMIMAAKRAARKGAKKARCPLLFCSS